MFKTIFQRLFWTSTAIIVFVVTTVSLCMFVLMNRFVLDEKMNSAMKASGSIEYLTRNFVEDDADSRYRHMYDSTLASWSLMVEADIAVVNQNGAVFASTNARRRVPQDLAAKVTSGETVRRHAGVKDGKVYIIGIPIRYNSEIIGGIFYFFPPGIMKNTLRDFSSMIFLSLIIAMMIALCLIAFESRHISGPLKQINTAVLEIASGKFDKRVNNLTSNDEIAQLTSSFNYMADSLQHLEEMRAGFISDISHELRTPMTSISGFVQGIIDGTIPKDKETEYLKIVLEESKRLSRLTNEMFEMTKISSPQYKLSVKQFDLAEAVRLCIISAEQKIDEKNLELDVWFESDVMNVAADPDAIKRVIINLLDNAIKFSDEGRTITIRVFEKGKHVVFEIINYGAGISDEDLPHIFDRFYKSDKSRSPGRAGAGLGLSFAKNIMNLHSQTITATSVPYEGATKKTTFTFTLEKA